MNQIIILTEFNTLINFMPMIVQMSLMCYSTILKWLPISFSSFASDISLNLFLLETITLSSL